jgi:VanZ family protein
LKQFTTEGENSKNAGRFETLEAKLSFLAVDSLQYLPMFARLRKSVNLSRDFLLSWLAALCGTVFTLIMMLKPGTSRVVDVPHKLLGGTDFTDAVGHVVLFCGLVFVWWTLAGHFSRRRALLLAALIVFGLGTFTEFAQSIVPDRGFAWYDLASNWIGVGVGVYLTICAKYRWFARRFADRL